MLWRTNQWPSLDVFHTSSEGTEIFEISTYLRVSPTSEDNSLRANIYCYLRENISCLASRYFQVGLVSGVAKSSLEEPISWHQGD